MTGTATDRPPTLELDEPGTEPAVQGPDGGAVDERDGQDEHLAARPGVVAVGDCSAWQSRRFGTRLHVEHWDDALHAPAAAVTTLLGGAAVHDPVPYFWSEQLGHRLQFAGYHRDADDVVVRRGPGESWALCWLRGGRLVAVLVADRPRDLLQARRAIAAGVHPDRELLADPAVPFRDL